jgi:fructokinase
VRATRPECQRIFDVNLRAPFYTGEIVRDSLQLASVMKMNDVEVPLVLGLLGLPAEGSLRAGAEQLLAAFPNLTLVAITRGGEGSLLVGRSDWHEHPGIPTKVADTIGAGDAFTAAMTHYLLKGAPLKVLNEAGNRWGSFVASQSGAMPVISPETLRRITSEIES